MTIARAFVTGIAGQDGTLLAGLLRARGAQVHGIARRAPGERLASLADVVVGDAASPETIARAVEAARPDACFHLAAHHRSSEATGESFAHDREVLHANVEMAHALLEAVRAHAPGASVVLAGSCQTFGAPERAPQDERTPMAPRNAYAIAKAAARHLGATYRERYGMRVATAILFQHESPLRGPGFLSQRIARGAADVARGRASSIEVGDLDAVVDWTWAEDACDALVRIAEAGAPRDYVVASGVPRTVRDFARVALARAGLPLEPHVRENRALVRGRPAVPYVGDPGAIASDLGWRAATPFEDWVGRLVDHHLAS